MNGARCGTSLVILALGATVMPSLATATDPRLGCQASKLEAVARSVTGMFACYASAAKAGEPTSPACLAKEATSLASRFAMAENAGPCLTNGDGGQVQSLLDTATRAALTVLRPRQDASTCASAKLSGTAGAASYLLRVYAKERRQASGSVPSALDKAFLRLKIDCLTATDDRAIARVVRDLTGDVVEVLWPASVTGIRVSRNAYWHLDGHVLAMGGPLSFNNFGGAYESGGSPPDGGAEITISGEALPQRPLRDQILVENARTGIDRTERLTVAGESAPKIVSHYGSGSATDPPDALASTTVTVYVPHASRLYKFHLDYNTRDTAEPHFLAVFNAMLESAAFAP